MSNTEIKEVKTMAAFKELIANEKLVVVDFHATWCGPCKLIAPKLKKFAETYPDILLITVDVDEVADVAAEYQVRAMPTIMYFKKGVKIGEVVGADIKKIEDKIKEHK